MATQSLSARTYGTPRVLPRRARRLLSTVAITGITLLVLAIYLMPFAYMAATSLKDRPQLAKPGAPLWPVEEATYTYQGGGVSDLQRADGGGHAALGAD